MKKGIVAPALTLILALQCGGIAHADSGVIKNPYGEPIVGVWIEVQGGRSGWASWRPLDSSTPHNVMWSYDTQGKNWEARVGRGGTPNDWGIVHNSGYTDLHGYVNMTLTEGVIYLPPFGKVYTIQFR